MKRIFLLPLLVALSLPIAVFAQKAEKISWRKTDDHWARKNSITFSFSPYNFSNHNGIGVFPMTLEYDRALPYNMSVSAIGIFAPLEGSAATDTPTVREQLWFAGAKINYNLPVVRNWLYFRVGMGTGIGVHVVSRYFDGGIIGKPVPPIERFVKPQFIIDMYWAFRAAKWLELRFAPGFASPSQLIIGPGINGNNFYLYYNFYGALGATVRF